MYLTPNPQFLGFSELQNFTAPGDAAISSALATFSNATSMGRNPLNWSFTVPGPSGLSGSAGLRPPPNIPLSTDGISTFPVGMGSGTPETTRHAKQGNTATATFVPINSSTSLLFPPQGVAENLPLFAIRDPRVTKFVGEHVEIDPMHIKIGNLLFSPYTMNKYIAAQQTAAVDPSINAVGQVDYFNRQRSFAATFNGMQYVNDARLLNELRRRDDDPLDVTMPEMDGGRHDMFYYKPSTLKQKTALVGICVNQVSAPSLYTHPVPSSAKTATGTDLTVTAHITGESQVRNFWGKDGQPGRHLWWMMDYKPSETHPFRLAWVPIASETRQFPKDKAMFMDAFGIVTERPHYYQGFVRAWHYQITTGNMSDGLLGLDDRTDLTTALRGTQQLALLDVFVPPAR
jgi:hypothetical protein